MRIKLYSENTNVREVLRIVDLLEKGGVIILPTDTIYAVACSVTESKAIERLCKLRKLDPEKAQLSILCDSISMAAQYTRIGDAAYQLIKRNQPGPFTFLLPPASVLPRLLKNRKTIGARIPDNEITRVIIQTLKVPLISATLYNEFQEREYICDPELIDEQYADRVDLIVDGGYGEDQHSAVIDCQDEEPVVIREGKKGLALS